jgi:bacillithiol system protein YtxJ
MMQVLIDLDHFHTLISAHIPFIIFKHSTRCSISDSACREVYDAIDQCNLDNVYLVDVITQKDVSMAISETTSIKHESPQIIFFNETGEPYAHASHGQVNERHIKHVLG